MTLLKGHFSFVVLEGFEPSQAEPESDVLPLHHRTIPNCECKGTAFFVTGKKKSNFFSKKVHLNGKNGSFWDNISMFSVCKMYSIRCYSREPVIFVMTIVKQRESINKFCPNVVFLEHSITFSICHQKLPFQYLFINQWDKFL